MLTGVGLGCGGVNISFTKFYCKIKGFLYGTMHKIIPSTYALPIFAFISFSDVKLQWQSNVAGILVVHIFKGHYQRLTLFCILSFAESFPEKYAIYLTFGLRKWNLFAANYNKITVLTRLSKLSWPFCNNCLISTGMWMF